jgi:hypothetical protein
MTAPVLFWMEGNPSTDFGFGQPLQQFHFVWELEIKNSYFFTHFFFLSNPFHKPINLILRHATPFPLPLPTFLVGPTL